MVSDESLCIKMKIEDFIHRKAAKYAKSNDYMIARRACFFNFLASQQKVKRNDSQVSLRLERGGR